MFAVQRSDENELQGKFLLAYFASRVQRRLAWQVQVFADIGEQLKYNCLSMSGWQYGEYYVAI